MRDTESNTNRGAEGLVNPKTAAWQEEPGSREPRKLPPARVLRPWSQEGPPTFSRECEPKTNTGDRRRK